MAILANTFSTYEAVGQREDLIDVITNISPLENWFISQVGKTKASARYHEWQTDALSSPAANAQVEGNDSPAMTAATPTTRTGNYTQILAKYFSVTKTTEAVNKAGRKSEIAYQKAMKAQGLAGDLEYACIINSASVSGDTATARQLKGVLGWISTNVTTATATGGTQNLTESLLNDNLQLIWAQGGTPRNTLVGAYQKRIIDAFTTNTRQVDAATKKVTAAISTYESSFGTITIRLHRVLNTTAPGTIINLGDMALWKLAWLRPVETVELAKTGSNTKLMIEAEVTLECRQEKGSGKMTGYKSA